MAVPPNKAPLTPEQSMLAKLANIEGALREIKGTLQSQGAAIRVLERKIQGLT